jgi:tRNA1Val (adenine37-N6)-methyltransferase
VSDPAATQRDEADVTEDALLRGRIRLFQPRRGPRASLDPILLAGFLTPPFGRFLDIGCGSGALAFLLLARDPAASGVAVELQARLAALAKRGRDDNGWRDQLQIVEGDVRRLEASWGSGAFDLVATNPPYQTPESSPPSPIAERALAHHEITLRLSEWVAVAARAVRPGGRVAAIMPSARSQELSAALHAHGLEITRLREVQARAGQPASRVLVEAGRGTQARTTCEPPLVVHDSTRGFTPEVRRMLGENI